MTEIEYIKATNRVKVSMALIILRDVLPGEDYMVGKEEFREILSRLQAIEERLFASLTINASDGEGIAVFEETEYVVDYVDSETIKLIRRR